MSPPPPTLGGVWRELSKPVWVRVGDDWVKGVLTEWYRAGLPGAWEWSALVLITDGARWVRVPAADVRPREPDVIR